MITIAYGHQTKHASWCCNYLSIAHKTCFQLLFNSGQNYHLWPTLKVTVLAPRSSSLSLEVKYFTRAVITWCLLQERVKPMPICRHKEKQVKDLGREGVAESLATSSEDQQGLLVCDCMVAWLHVGCSRGPHRRFLLCGGLNILQGYLTFSPPHLPSYTCTLHPMPLLNAMRLGHLS